MRPKSAQLEQIKNWLRAIGFFRGFMLVSFIPVAMGAIVAWWQSGWFSRGIFFLTLASVWAVHIGANLINDYYDHVSGTDDINEIKTPFSGGTRIIQDGLIKAEKIKLAAIISFSTGSGLLLLLSLLTGRMILLFWLLGILSGVLYSVKPFWLAYRGFGETLVGLTFGPFLVLTSYYAQTLSLSVSAMTAGLILGLFSSAIITINQIPDIEADRKSGKYNLVALYGRKTGILIWTVLLWAAIIVIFTASINGVFPFSTIIALVMAFPIYFLTIKAVKRTEQLEGVVYRCRYTILSQVGIWFFLSLGFFLDKWEVW